MTAKEEELEQEVRRLRAQRDRLHRYAKRANRTIRWRGQSDRAQAGLLVRLLGFGTIQAAARRWFNAVGAAKPIPREESADLFAAIVRRILLIGVVGFAVGILPTVLLTWQNFLIREQLKSQAADTLIVRRNELLRTIYETGECEPNGAANAAHSAPINAAETQTQGSEEPIAANPIAELCPKHPLRIRQDAVLALVQIDGKETDLREANLSGARFEALHLVGAKLWGANLRGAQFWDADFSEANLGTATLIEAEFWNGIFSGTQLSHANLNGAKLVSADFQGADLRHANLSDTNLWTANFSDAKLWGANFSGANLEDANFRDAVYLSQANLSGAKLWGVDLRGTDIEQSQLAETCGDSETRLLPGLERPDHWSDQPVDFWEHRVEAGCPKNLAATPDGSKP